MGRTGICMPARAPRGVDPGVVSRVLEVIPKARLRDRVLFGLIAATGLRASEALGAYVEDLCLARDDEHLTVTGKGQRTRTVLLDDPALLVLLRRYLRATGYQRGPLFRAEKPHRWAAALRLGAAAVEQVLPCGRGAGWSSSTAALPRHRADQWWGAGGDGAQAARASQHHCHVAVRGQV